MGKPLISVVIPVYNVYEYLEKSLDSVINQSYTNYELILVDDGSNDGSGRICDTYEKKYEHVKVVHKENGGIISARREGASIADGEYIFSMDADDWIDSDKLIGLADVIEMEYPDLVYMAGYKKNYEGFEEEYDSCLDEGIYTVEEVLSKLKEQSNKNDFFFQNDFLLSRSWQLCVRKDLYMDSIGSVSGTVSLGEENISFFNCLIRCNKIYILKDYGYHYLRRQGSISDVTEKEYKKKFQLWFFYMNRLFNHEKLLGYRKEFIEGVFFHMMSFFYEDINTEMFEYLFPFTKVKKGSRIVIYGAGKFGACLVNAIQEKREDYEIVLWIDRSIEGKIYGFDIANLEDIKEVSYDYVVMAIMWYSVAEKIAIDLEKVGVERSKIAFMHNGVMNERLLPEWLTKE